MLPLPAKELDILGSVLDTTGIFFTQTLCYSSRLWSAGAVAALRTGANTPDCPLVTVEEVGERLDKLMSIMDDTSHPSTHWTCSRPELFLHCSTYSARRNATTHSLLPLQHQYNDYTDRVEVE